MQPQQFRLDLPEHINEKIADFIKTRSLKEVDRFILALIAGQAILSARKEWTDNDFRLLDLQMGNAYKRLKASLEQEEGPTSPLTS